MCEPTSPDCRQSASTDGGGEILTVVYHPDSKAFWKEIVQTLALSVVLHFPNIKQTILHSYNIPTVVAGQWLHLGCRKSP